MLYLIGNDREILNSSYKQFLMNAKEFLQKYSSDPLSYPDLIEKLLFSGAFSQNHHSTYNNNFSFLDLYGMGYDGMQVMHGIFSCRHGNGLTFDILKALGIESSLVYVNIDQEGNWHRLNNDMGANHVVVEMKNEEERYLIDTVNKFVVKVLPNNDLIEVHHSTIDQGIIDSFQDENVERIGKVLTKYYSLRDFGITSVL